MSTAIRQDYIHQIFEKQTDVAIKRGYLANKVLPLRGEITLLLKLFSSLLVYFFRTSRINQTSRNG